MLFLLELFCGILQYPTSGPKGSKRPNKTQNKKQKWINKIKIKHVYNYIYIIFINDILGPLGPGVGCMMLVSNLVRMWQPVRSASSLIFAPLTPMRVLTSGIWAQSFMEPPLLAISWEIGPPGFKLWPSRGANLSRDCQGSGLHKTAFMKLRVQIPDHRFGRHDHTELTLFSVARTHALATNPQHGEQHAAHGLKETLQGNSL